MTNTISKSRLETIEVEVRQAVATTPVCDVHTHLYDPAFGPLLLWGIDALLVYHYVVAEAFRFLPLSCERFWALSKTEQANLIWEALFIEHSPVSEACRGVLTTLNALGLDANQRDLPAIRQWFAEWKVEDYLERCLELAGVSTLCMTNSPFDDVERGIWERGFTRHPAFTAALRIDPLLLQWNEAVPRLAQWSYAVTPELSPKTVDETRRFLADWTRRIQARYLMVSLPPGFNYPAQTECAQLMEKAVLPHCRDYGLPFALMLGVKRGVNPGLRLAGDGVGPCQLESLENLCAQNPSNKFLVTVLARENQHGLCVAARKFPNLHLFGCWWFTNIPTVIDEMTRMRLELLGTSFTVQHSDARVLDQIIYKWRHSRAIIADVLVEKYLALAQTGWEPSNDEIERDVKDLFGGTFAKFCSPVSSSIDLPAKGFDGQGF
ncbi:MAG: glucuronate isomerase [Candidatus Omnitrophica bacterium]|nr:glucuronate isomerase [Candidatus Omnitrophota bacterium]